MANYLSDRAFTDYVHQNLALPQIYEPLMWKQKTLDEGRAKYIDMQHGIDYIFDCKGITITVQERFREKKYSNFSDFTIRYRRDLNLNADRKESEYYKMKADYFTYGITDGEKTDHTSCKEFLKFAVIDLLKVYNKIDTGFIKIIDNKKNYCAIEEKNLICPIKHNTDGSSSFFPIDIKMLCELFGSEIVILQKGFFK